MPKRQIKVKEILQDIRARMDDTALMEKYNLSAQGLQSAFKKMMDAGLLKQSDREPRLTNKLSTYDPGADVNARDKNGNTPLILAAREGRVTDVKELLNRGADVNAKNAFFRDALESAQVGGYEEIVTLLKAHGASCPPEAISKPDIVQDVRSGMTDLALMNKYDLSYKELHNHLENCVRKGDLKRLEVEQRSLEHQHRAQLQQEAPRMIEKIQERERSRLAAEERQRQELAIQAQARSQASPGSYVADLKVIGGDFPQGSGAVYSQSFRFSWASERIPFAEIEAVELITEDNKKKFGSAFLRGLAGGVLLGPAGLLAGALSGKRRKELVFACKFRDGRAFLATTNEKGWGAILIAKL